MKFFLIYKIVINSIFIISLTLSNFFEAKSSLTNFLVVRTDGFFDAHYLIFKHSFKSLLFYNYILENLVYYLNKVYKDYGDVYLYIIVFEVNPNYYLPKLLSQPYIFKFNSKDQISRTATDVLFENLKFSEYNSNKADICVMIRFLNKPFINTNKNIN